MKKIIIVLMVVVLGYFGWQRFSTRQTSNNDYAVLSVTNKTMDGSYYKSQVQQVRVLCPEPSRIVKQGTTWHSQDQKWASHTPSTASQVLSFIGTQWNGKAGRGQVVCIYRTNENAAFTLNLEATSAMVVVEPEREANWSARINNSYRLCRSVNPADCGFIQEKPITKTQQDIFEDIKWQGDQKNHSKQQ